jgi:hypothetical protein
VIREIGIQKMYWMTEHNGINSCINKKWAEMTVLCDYLASSSLERELPILGEDSNATGGRSQEGKSETSYRLTVSDMQHHATDMVSGRGLTLR